MLAEYGAVVTKVEPPAGDFWRGRDPRVFEHYNRGKDSVIADLGTSGGAAAVRRLLEKENEGGNCVLLTNLPESELKAAGAKACSRRLLCILFPSGVLV